MLSHNFESLGADDVGTDEHTQLARGSPQVSSIAEQKKRRSILFNLLSIR